jgi:hypothetical protein
LGVADASKVAKCITHKGFFEAEHYGAEDEVSRTAPALSYPDLNVKKGN